VTHGPSYRKAYHIPDFDVVTDPVVRSAFERAERDSPPAALAVENRPRNPVLSGSEAVRELELA